MVTPMEPHAIALQTLGVRKVAVATYYGDELNQAIVNYFSRFALIGADAGFEHDRRKLGALQTRLWLWMKCRIWMFTAIARGLWRICRRSMQCTSTAAVGMRHGDRLS